MSLYSPGCCIADRYEVVGRPLIGGMGIVYVCFDYQEQRPAALKTFVAMASSTSATGGKSIWC